jgi:hypothetical protein
MALVQQLTGNLRNLSGNLKITAPPGELEALQALAVELSQREGIVTHGDIIILQPTPPPPPPDEGQAEQLPE